jgi:hypothetical protein
LRPERIAAAGAWILFFVYFAIPPLLFASSSQGSGPRITLLWLGGAYFLAAGVVLHLLLSIYAALWTHVLLLWLLKRLGAADRLRRP